MHDKRFSYFWQLASASAFGLMLGSLPLVAQDQPQPYPPYPPQAAPEGDSAGAGGPPQPYSGYPPQAAQGNDAAPANDSSPGAGGNGGSANFQTFYDALMNQGTWIQTPDYGYVWQPQINDPQWAPYTDGHWVYTDAGWTWASDEPFGWATYHYGRWVNLNGAGWVWVPGYTWGPAWVSWRFGDGYCGWAPLPPDSLVGVDYDAEDEDGFHIGGDCDSYFGIGAGWYTFLPVAYLGDRDYRGYYVNRYNNYRLINRTTNVTNLNVTSGSAAGGRGAFGGVSLGGPSLVQVNAMVQTPIARVRLASSPRMGPATLSNGSLAVFAPRLTANRTAMDAHPAQVGAAFGHLNVNRGVDIGQPVMVNSRLGVAPPSAFQVQEARIAQAHAATGVATSATGVPSSAARPFKAVQTSSTSSSSTRTSSQRSTHSSQGPAYSRGPSNGYRGQNGAYRGGGSYPEGSRSSGGSYPSGGYGGGGRGGGPSPR